MYVKACNLHFKKHDQLVPAVGKPLVIIDGDDQIELDLCGECRPRLLGPITALADDVSDAEPAPKTTSKAKPSGKATSGSGTVGTTPSQVASEISDNK